MEIKKFHALMLCAFMLLANICFAAQKPNVIIIFADDQGYQDLGCFGSKTIRTPNLDRLAKEGTRFTDFYSAANVCSPSRAALLTGSYPVRVGIPRVLFPRDKTGLNPKEVTIAKMLKKIGYKTAAIGKWHLGHHAKFLPTNHGFDSYLGIPYSNDMSIDPTMKLADNIVWLEGANAEVFKAAGRKRNKVPLMRGIEVVEYPANQHTLTQRYTDEAIKIIDSAAGKPFFIYFASTMPHIPLYASKEFEGKSAAGFYGDAVEELDSCVGRLIDHLKKKGLDKNTLVIYTSDNGPWKLGGNDPRRKGGSALPLRGYKFGTYDGGMREPTLMWWPGKIPAGNVCGELASTIDLLPTIAHITGAEVPTDRVIDGKNIWPLITGQAGAKTPHSAYFYYKGTRLEAVRQGDWKLRVTSSRRRKGKKGKKPAPTKGPTVELYNLREDISESKNLASEHPERVQAMQAIMKAFDAKLKANARPAGKL